MYLNGKQLSLLYNFLQQCLAVQAYTWRRQMMGVLDSQGCCNKLAQTWWFQTTEMYSLIVLEAASQKSRCQRAHSPSKNSRGESFLVSSSFKRLQVFFVLSKHNFNLCPCLHMALSSVSSSSLSSASLTWTSLSVSYSPLLFIEILTIELRARLNKPG